MKELTLKYINFPGFGIQSGPGSDLHVATWEQTNLSPITRGTVSINFAAGSTNTGSLLFLRGVPFPADYSVVTFLTLKKVSHSVPSSLYHQYWAKTNTVEDGPNNFIEDRGLDRADSNYLIYMHSAINGSNDQVGGLEELRPFSSLIAFAWKDTHLGLLPDFLGSSTESMVPSWNPFPDA